MKNIDQSLRTRNLRLAVALFMVAVVMFGVMLLWARYYLSIGS